MVEEVLVRETFSTQHISCGKELLGRINGAGIELVAAFWVRERTAEISTWTLDVVTPEVDKQGPLKVYERIRKAISLPTPLSCGLDINGIEVLGLNYSFFKKLTKAIKSIKSKARSAEDLSDVQISQVVVDDSLMDLYIYKFPVSKNHKP